MISCATGMSRVGREGEGVRDRKSEVDSYFCFLSPEVAILRFFFP